MSSAPPAYQGPNPFAGQQRSFGAAAASTGANTLTNAEDAFQALYREVQQQIQATGGLSLGRDAAGDEERVGQLVQQLLETRLTQYSLALSGQSPETLAARVCDEILGWGPLAAYMRDPEVEEIALNDFDRGFIFYAGGRKVPLPQGFESYEHARTLLNRKIAAGHGYEVTPRNPHQDGQLPDGSRVFVAVSPLIGSQIVANIRRFRGVARTLEELVALRSITPGLKNFLSAAVRSYLTIVISGGTGTGKTTFLQALSSVFPPEDRVVTIEDTPELDLHRLPDWVSLRVRRPTDDGTPGIDMGLLVRDALRMRPDRIILGEARGAEMVDIFTACNTGHEGSLFTLHANSAWAALTRMVTLYRMGQPLDPEEVRREMVAAVQLVVHLKRDFRTGQRYVSQVIETRHMEGRQVAGEVLFEAAAGQAGARWQRTVCKSLERIAERVPEFDLLRDVVQLEAADS